MVCDYCMRPGWYDMGCISCVARHCINQLPLFRSWSEVESVAIKYGHALDDLKQEIKKQKA